MCFCGRRAFKNLQETNLFCIARFIGHMVYSVNTAAGLLFFAFFFCNERFEKQCYKQLLPLCFTCKVKVDVRLHKQTFFFFFQSAQGLNSVADFSAIKELDTLNNEIVDLQR